MKKWVVTFYSKKVRDEISDLPKGILAKTDKTPKQEIQKAVVLMNEYKNEKRPQNQ